MLRSKNLLKVHTNNTRVKRQKKLQAVEEKGAYGFQRFFHPFIFLTTGAPTKAIHFGESGGELSNLQWVKTVGLLYYEDKVCKMDLRRY